MNKWIIESPLDQDLYKLTTCQMFYKMFRDSTAVYKFKCRSGQKIGHLGERIRQEIDSLKDLKFTADDVAYLESLGHFSFDFLTWLRHDFKFSPVAEVLMYSEDDVLHIETRKGTRLVIGMMYEVFIMAIVQEVYGAEIEFGREEPIDFDGARIKTIEKCAKIIASEIHVIEFGTRRRHSHAWQDEVIGIMSRAGAICGTSNMYFAKKYNLSCTGTMPHEYYQAWQAAKGSPRLREFQKAALRAWIDFYKDSHQLRTALTDIVGMDAFLNDFDEFIHEFTGFRHDSGDPFVWVDKLFDYLTNHRIDPMTRLAVFSDGLDVDKAIELANHCDNLIRCSFGIGTNLTNDLGYKPLQNVMKMIECDGMPTAKLSDSHGKGMCESEAFAQHLKEVFSGE